MDPSLRQKWILVLVPHHVGRGATERFSETCGKHGLAVQDSALFRPENRCDVMVVDMMGTLAELYELASAAWIGGACHNKVHNVLEPAVHGAWLACGMRYKNSREAIMMREAGLLRPIPSAAGIIAWLKDAERSDQKTGGLKDMRTRGFIEQNAGAARTIAGQIVDDLTGHLAGAPSRMQGSQIGERNA
jgi:3-deoxy-D-manno-octulosonic-acid transferase